MRRLLFAGTAIATLATFPGLAQAQVYAADVYRPGVVVGPPVVAAPMVESQVYLAPGTTYVQPGTQYQEQPIYMDGRRYYRDCDYHQGLSSQRR